MLKLEKENMWIEDYKHTSYRVRSVKVAYCIKIKVK